MELGKNHLFAIVSLIFHFFEKNLHYPASLSLPTDTKLSSVISSHIALGEFYGQNEVGFYSGKSTQWKLDTGIRFVCVPPDQLTSPK